MDTSQIYDQVRDHYSAASKGTSEKYGEAIAKSFGYSESELANIPEGANLGLSCGNPFAITSLRDGETVIDLGSGAGFDIFLASTKIGPTGRAIGIDMNDDMLARANSIKETKGTSADNVTFIKGVITEIPLDDGIADCIISNCVVNLVPAPEKPQVFREMYRLLRPGGRVAVSDILAKKELPEKLRNDISLYVGCIAGASLLEEYEKWLKEAGFDEVVIADTKADLNAYTDIGEDGTKKADGSAPPVVAQGMGGGCCGVQPTSGCAPTTMPAADSSERADLNEWVGSYKIYAVKK